MDIEKIITELDELMYEINSQHTREGKAGEDRHDALEEAYKNVSNAVSALEDIKDQSKSA